MTASFRAQRLSTDTTSIITRLFSPAGEALCYALEPGLSRLPHPGIPAGVYPLRLRTVGEKHAEYLKRYGATWHRGMVEILVPNRTAIEFHVGNTIADTLGCLLAGTAAIAPPGNGSGHWEVSGSRSAYEKVYPILRDAIAGGSAQLEVLAIGQGGEA